MERPLNVLAAISAGVLPPDHDGRPKLRATDFGMTVDVVPNYDADDAAALELLKAWCKAKPSRWADLGINIGINGSELHSCELHDGSGTECALAYEHNPSLARAICLALVVAKEK